ncbi:phosphatidylinositol-binding clathrin assembly protein, partial [Aplochiton taeniatus]
LPPPRPALPQAPSSLLEALEQHLASLEGKKIKELTADNRATTLSSAVSSLSNTGMSFSRMDEKERQQALEEEQARLQALKDQRLKEIGVSTPPSASPSSQSISSGNNNSHHHAPQELFPPTTHSTNSMPNLNSDLFGLQPAFIPAVQSNPSITTANNAWGGFDSLGDLMKPTVPAHSQPPPPIHLHAQHHHHHHHGGKLLANDLDSSLANLVGNLQFGGPPAKKPDIQWSQPGEKKLTGGNNWQNKTMSTTQWTPAPMAPQPVPVQHMAPAPMAFPMTTPQVPVYGMVPPQMGPMGGVQMMAPQPMMYNPPVLRPTNPFAPMPGAQMQFM